MSELDDRNGQGDGAGTVPSRPHFGRRLVLVTTAALLVLLGATSGVVWAHQWWLDRPVNQALETSGDAVDKVLRRLDDAKTLEDVSAAGALAPESATGEAETEPPSAAAAAA